MKLGTLKTIENLLREKAETAKLKYRNQKAFLEEKYHTEWLREYMTAEEASLLDSLKTEWNDASDALDDFLQHQW